MLNQELINNIRQTSVITKLDVDTVLKFKMESRDIAYGVISVQEQLKFIDISSEDVKKYFNKYIMDNIFRGLFLNIDKLNTHKKLKRESIIFQCYESFLKKLYKYYEYDENMEGLSNGLLYEIKYIYKFYNGNHPLTIYPHIIKLNESNLIKHKSKI